MSSKHLYYTMLAVIILLIVGLVGGAYEAEQLLAARSQQLVGNRLQSAVLADEQDQLTKAKQDIQKYQTLANIARSVVPQDKDQAQTVRQIVGIAAASGIALNSITFPSSTLGGPGGSAAGSTPQLSQLTPVKGIAGVYDLQLSVQSDATHPVPYSRFITFLSALEQNRRTALVDSITLQPDALNRNDVSFTLILDEYIKP